MAHLQNPQRVAHSTCSNRAPKWPRISQKSGLKAQHLLPDDCMVQVPGCLTQEEAAKFVTVAESVGFQHSTSRGPAYGEAFRDNDRIQFQDQQLADQLWQAAGLQQLCAGLGDEEGCPVRLNPNIRIYRYRPGQKFGKHIDESNELGCGQYTQYTLLIYLSTCGGGETIFYGESGPAAAHALFCRPRRAGGRNCKLAAVTPQPGLALLHRHGDECMEHEAAAVTAGIKYVLRSDVVFQQC
ncbi:hypothetical protein CHLNCDRAFT_50409 [Chlorella variabilis]|uniref:Fe2OG dioxygenase domain-containing protein n=1 Tax=Chlorella variabilis TaxID=554065 RepID=E1Z678_CHLVA|nr:hypothetical protein CHLNCDRAFT_50409 [Chlorella variabilis]EFN58883.1 hypothetical protein CHLNCDRAFT_50409 [Chlorella variabilis]|eukprot:XP_005850985.1 hypothetical protein CHLNCDRAFT_50409 [Chlorella variabilis]